MSRVDELAKKYPGIPREVIIKYEVLSRGMKDTETLDTVSYWVRAGGTGGYQSYDQDVTLKQLAEKRPGRVKPGYILRLDAMYTKAGLGARIQRDSRSTYEIREISSGNFALFVGDEGGEEVVFPSHEPWEAVEERIISKGKPATSLVVLNRNCFRINPVRYCEYFNSGEQCKFCNYNSTQEDARNIGTRRDITVNLEETVEAYKIISSEVELVEGQFQMGGFIDKEQEAKMHLGFVERLARAASYKPNFNLNIQPVTRKDLQRFKDAGVNSTCYEIEVWDPDIFEEVCPGKAKHRGREGFLEAYLEAVDILGVGNVGGTMVGGVSLIPENVHKTWQEARDSHVEGNTWMIERGVIPSFTTIRLGPGSVYGNIPGNRAKMP
ncbi:MAG: hypothetical protein Q7O66_14195, partial [Dehalococcoidia bacterium]|nr:hypothetical protein [Dehalococcoidia bacterium]